MATIDSLNIEINVSNKEALSNIAAVAEQLQSLKTAFDNSGIKNIAEKVNTAFADASRNITGIDLKVVDDTGVKAVSEVLDEVRGKISDVETQASVSAEGINGNLMSVGQAIREASGAAESLGTSLEQAGNYSGTLDTSKTFTSAPQMADIKETLRATGEAASNSGQDLQKMLEGLSSVSEETKNVRPGIEGVTEDILGLGSLGTAAINVLHTVVKKLVAAFVQLVRESMEVAKQIGKFALDKLAHGVKEVVKSVSGFNRVKKIVDGISNTFKMLRNQIKRMAIRSLIRNITQGLAEAFNDLAENDARTSESITMLKNAMGQLRSSIVTIAAPIVNALAPALIRIIDLATQAANALARLAALLTGQHTYTIAKGFEGIEDAAGGASQAVKEASKTILGFDEINKLNADSKSGGGGGSGSGSGGGIFEEVSVGEWDFSSWGEALEAFLKWFRGTGIPRLQEALDGAVEKLNQFNANVHEALTFRDVQALIGSIGADIGRVFNEAVTNFDWRLAGQALGDVWQSVFNFSGNLITTFDFHKLGKKIAELFNGAVGEIDPQTIGNTLGGLLAGGITLASGFLTTFDFQAFFSSVTATVTNIFDRVKSAVAGYNWDEGSVKALDSFLRFVGDINIPGFVDAVFPKIQAAFEALFAKVIQFVRSPEGRALIDSIVELYMEITQEVMRVKLVAKMESWGAGFRWLLPRTSILDNLFGSSDQATTELDAVGGAATGAAGDIDSLLGSITGLNTNGTNAIGAFGRDTKSALSSASREGKGSISGLATTIKSETENARVKGSGSISQLNTQSQASLAELNTKGTQSGNALKGNLVTAASDARTQVTQQFSKIPGEASNSIKGTSSKIDVSEFQRTGKNMVEGIIKGMGQFDVALDDWARSFRRAVNKKFEIKSPSRVFKRETGVYLTLGIVEGMKEAVPAVAAVCDDITATANGIMRGMELDVPRFDGIGDVNVGNYQDRTTNQINNMLNAILQTIQRNQNTQPIENVITLDGKVISRSVTNYQRNNDRRFNTVMA